jgi:hypothetical protein
MGALIRSSFLSRAMLMPAALSVVLGFGSAFVGAENAFASSSSSAQPTKRESARVAREAIDLLARVPSGRKVLEKAQAFWKVKTREGLLKHLAYGPVSRTDAVLTRHYHTETDEEVRERFVTVVLRKDQPLIDVAMDLGHELIHAITPPSWDPYDPQLTPGSYMHAAIEADGGEVDAVYAECEIAVDFKRELEMKTSRCDRYLVLSGPENKLAVDRTKIRADFYRVGKWDSFVRGKLGKESSRFPLLSPKVPELYSATGGAPYPVSLMREYEELNRVACENAQKREHRRSPASLGGARFSQSMGSRCSGMSFSSRAQD